MRAIRFVVTLLAAACLVGTTTYAAEHATTATPPVGTGAIDASQPVESSSHRSARGASVAGQHYRARNTSEVPPAPSTSPQARTHPCTSPTPSAAPSASPSPTPSASPSGTAPDPPGTSPACGPDGTAGILPIAAPACTVIATGAAAVNSAKPGDTVCLAGNVVAGTQLTVTVSGTEHSPITITGTGDTPVKGIRVNASNVVVQGFTVVGAAAPGVQLKGDNLVLQSTTIDHPTGGDYDGIRFFGDGIKILHNRIMHITNTHGAHADCMQTFATTTPTSHNVLISGNRCENIDNQCLIAQGPHSAAGNGSGKGESSGLTFSDNYCDAHASQAVHIDDVQNVSLTSNDIEGKVRKAFNLINQSTGAKISCNQLGSGVGTELATDSSSRAGLQNL